MKETAEQALEATKATTHFDPLKEVRLKLRECPRCRVWTECGACPDCGMRLGDPPYAKPVQTGFFHNMVPLPPASWKPGVSRWPGAALPREQLAEEEST